MRPDPATMAYTFPLPDPALTDGTVLLREPAADDVGPVFEACQDADIQRFTFIPVPYAREHARQWVDQAPRRRASGEGLSLVIADARDGDALLGTVGLLRPDWPNRSVEVGYWVAPWGRGRGAATRAAGLLARWAIKDLDFARIRCHVDVDNVVSQRVAERAGFAREGVLRSVLEFRGRRWWLVAHSLIAEDLEP
ncbi:MAG TPA: GNAT family N-acetyltransferase [Baekduia sp.]